MKAIYLGSLESSKTAQLHEGEVCTIQTSLFATDSNFEDNFYDIVFADGFRMYDVSGYCLEEIK